MPSLHPRPLPPPSLPRPEDPAGRVEAIFTAPEAGAPMEQQGVVVVVPGVGIVGDRYALGSGTWSAPRWHDKELTLFEAEVADALGIEPYVPRRNIVLRGVSLYGLIGVHFRLGEALLLGVRPCDPCRYIQQLTGTPGLTKGLAGERGGLRARILEGGRIRLGDTIEVVGLAEQ
ncbi:MAG: MOSC domain-containing protein [Dehalococcoidia bacterium]